MRHFLVALLIITASLGCALLVLHLQDTPRSEWEIAFDRIEIGMTKADVLGLLGPTGESFAQSDQTILRWGKSIKVILQPDTDGTSRVIGKQIIRELSLTERVRVFFGMDPHG